MKSVKNFIAIAVLFYSSTAYTQMLVSLHSNGAVQHFSGANALINAYTAAVTGDTIYLPGGSFVPPANFDKGLTIYGAGHYQDSTQATGKSFIAGTVTMNENADHFHMEGIEILGSFIISNNAAVNQLTLKYCKINVTFNVMGNLSNPSNNLALIGNVFIGDVTLSNATNVSIYNSMLQGHFVNSVGNQIYNCIFLFPGGGGDPMINGEMVNNNLYNNVFLQTGWAIYSTITGNTYKYNLFVSSAPNLGPGAVSENNYFGIAQSSIFIAQSGSSFDYTHNYHLQAPFTYPGSDGLQVGMYGGIFPYKEGAVPSNPHIRVKTISPTTDGSGNLHVNIQVAAQNN